VSGFESEPAVSALGISSCSWIRSRRHKARQALHGVGAAVVPLWREVRSSAGAAGVSGLGGSAGGAAILSLHNPVRPPPWLQLGHGPGECASWSCLHNPVRPPPWLQLGQGARGFSQGCARRAQSVGHWAGRSELRVWGSGVLQLLRPGWVSAEPSGAADPGAGPVLTRVETNYFLLLLLTTSYY